MSAPSPRRVALVIGQLSRGGAEGQLAEVARRLDRSRFAPYVYCISPQTEPVGRIIRESGVPLRVVAGSSLQRIAALIRHFDSDCIDLVHAWLFLANAACAIAHVRRPGRPLITSARNRKLQGRANRLANMLAFRRSQAIVVNSRDVARYIEDLYWAPKERIRVIFNGIDTERFHPADSQALSPTIVSVGRLVAQKNHALFLAAAAELGRWRSDLRFVIVGDGPLRSTLEEQARQAGLQERVVFTGAIDDVENVLRGAALFWLTSRWEGMPNVVLEAMASGVPAIATDVGGARELIRDGVDGFVLRSEDREGFVARSQQLLSDCAEHQRFASQARQRAEAFSMDAMVGALSALYEEVLP